MNLATHLRRVFSDRSGSVAESVVETTIALGLVSMVSFAVITGVGAMSKTSSDVQRAQFINEVVDRPEQQPGWLAATTGTPIAKAVTIPNGPAVNLYLWSEDLTYGKKVTAAVARGTTVSPATCQTRTTKSECIYATAFVANQSSAPAPTYVTWTTGPVTGNNLASGTIIASRAAPAAKTKWRFSIDGKGVTADTQIVVKQNGSIVAKIPVSATSTQTFTDYEVDPAKGTPVQLVVGDQAMKLTKLTVYPAP
ncbi:hypothetical protein [Agromyces humi]|uniref:hypothetical protein n=1 Tax=Agromyces humi TaxID=1766800 RepID=UPI00135A5AD5|nr:hypothetical protein [Agromyces humi]